MSKELDPFKHEQGPDSEALRQAGAERQEELHQDFEKVELKTPEQDAEKLQREAFEKAASIERDKARETVQEAAPEKEKPRVGRRSTKELEASYNTKMAEVRTHMSPSSRAFSKVIHNKVIEGASGAIGSTVARPNAILSGAVFAFVLTLGVYILAKNLGYPLSGFETIGAFLLGWILGITYDFLKVMITGRK
jgi:hypothetical protein